MVLESVNWAVNNQINLEFKITFLVVPSGCKFNLVLLI